MPAVLAVRHSPRAQAWSRSMAAQEEMLAGRAGQKAYRLRRPGHAASLWPSIRYRGPSGVRDRVLDRTRHVRPAKYNRWYALHSEQR